MFAFVISSAIDKITALKIDVKDSETIVNDLTVGDRDRKKRVLLIYRTFER